MAESNQNGNPTIERMMQILDELERTPEGLSQADIVTRTGLARSSVYRILNSLQDCRVIREATSGTFVLGNRLLELAERVTPASGFFKLARFLQPELELLAYKIGQTCKISVMEAGAIMVIAGATAKTPHALSYTVGEFLPVHAGGASKVLMANLPPEEQKGILNRQLTALTDKTITDQKALLVELDQVKKQGWAEDTGEYSLNVCAFAAPLYSTSRNVIAALSVPFLASEDVALREQVKQDALEGAKALSSSIAKFVS